MKRENISNAISNISDRHVQEAADYTPAKGTTRTFKKAFWKSIIAATLVLCLLVGGSILFSIPEDMVITAFACGTNEEITASGAVLMTGTITDSGVQQGHPLMFYLTGEDIASVRFSCKNQQLCFMDWTEKREEYGLAQNFTVLYGEDEREYYYLTIEWTPNATIQKLHEGSTIGTLPDELREDLIVMEITFANGKTTVKAIKVSLLDDGTFFATFDNYRITGRDDFINRPDSEAIPRDILYGPPQEGVDQTEENPVDAYDTGADNMPDELLEKAEAAARAYYSGTVFQVIEMLSTEQSETKAVFSVKVSRGGVIQDPNRTITLQLNDSIWEVTGEGY